MTIGSPPWPPPLLTQTYRLASNTALFSSPLTGSIQRSVRSGGPWQFDAQFTLLDDTRAALWRAFLCDQQDQASTFYWSFFPKGLPRAYTTGWDAGTPSWGGAPVIDGASQTGRSIKVKTLTVGATFKAGDSIAFENGTRRELHMVTADVTADGSGKATFSIVPDIRISPADGAAAYFDGNATDVTKRAACAVFIDPKSLFSWQLSGFQTTFGLKLIEAVV